MFWLRVHWNDQKNKMKMMLLMYGVENRSIHRVWPGCNFLSFLFLYKSTGCKYSNITMMRCPTLLNYSEISMRTWGHWKLFNLRLFKSCDCSLPGGRETSTVHMEYCSWNSMRHRVHARRGRGLWWEAKHLNGAQNIQGPAGTQKAVH